MPLMSKLSKDEVRRLARLSRIRLSNLEVIAFQRELSAILDYFAQLQKVDTSGVEPTAQVTGLTNATRPDEEADYGATREALLANAPATEKGYIKVRRVLG
jgi:aspartyl-tRNA(Asn)/glutamyl-tRNA(Gln) amidotransferase subunit C